MVRGSVADLAELLRAAERVLVFTGAGISTSSGISDYRGPEGVWRRRRPVYYGEFLRSEAARIEYWEGKLEAWDQFKGAEPNATHESIYALEAAGKLLSLVTQNIDGLHQRAGHPKERLVELHGTMLEVECQSCGERSDPDPAYEAFQKTGRPPVCVKCDGTLKPATISFGQNLRPEDLEAAFRAANEADLAISLGSTLSVMPAAEIPLLVGQNGHPYAIINRGETDHDDHPSVTVRLEGAVEDLFPDAVEQALA